MDPSYKNSNSGDGSGGMNPNGAMQPVAPAGPVVSEQLITPVQPVAPVQPVMPGQFVASAQPSQRVNPITHRPMGPVVGGAAMNQMSGQMTSPMMNNALPNQNVMQPMSSDAGDDIVLAGAEKKKPKLSTIIIVAFAVLFAVVVLVLAITRTIGGGPDKVSDSSDVKKAFNSYVNYVMWGKESDEEVNMDEFDGNTLYYLKLSGGELDHYLLKVQDLYDMLNSSYSSTGEMTDISALNVFFHDYVAMLPLTIEEIGEEYALRGKEATQDLIDERYNKNKATGILLSDYIGKEKELLELYMRIVMDANNSGCVEISTLNKGCYSLTKEELGAVETKLFDLTNIQDSMYFSAMETLRHIYDDIINMEGQDG